MKKHSLTNLLAKIDGDERGVVSLETILIIGAIALPILIFVIKVGWPLIEKYFTQGVNDLQTDATAAEQGS
ncbi:MAG: TadE/TadG family type IV pilus assembly protein [Thermoguttaceae bacterium]